MSAFGLESQSSESRVNHRICGSPGGHHRNVCRARAAAQRTLILEMSLQVGFPPAGLRELHSLQGRQRLRPPGSACGWRLSRGLPTHLGVCDRRNVRRFSHQLHLGFALDPPKLRHLGRERSSVAARKKVDEDVEVVHWRAGAVVEVIKQASPFWYGRERRIQVDIGIAGEYRPQFGGQFDQWVCLGCNQKKSRGSWEC